MLVQDAGPGTKVSEQCAKVPGSCSGWFGLISKKVDFTERFVELITLKISTGHYHEEADFHKFPPYTEFSFRASGEKQIVYPKL